VAGLGVVAAVAGAGYQQWATVSEMRKYQAPGRLVAVDGIKLHIYCVGSDSPTVILEAGLGKAH